MDVPGEATNHTAGPPVLVVDDHPLVAVALVAALQRHGLEAHHVDPATRGWSTALDQRPAGLVVLDLDLGVDADGTRLDGVSVVPVARSKGWAAVVLTGSKDRSRIAAAVAAGAVGWLAKSAPFEQLVTAVERAAQGKPVMDATERERLVREHSTHGRAGADLDRRWSQLTQREREVLGRLVAGYRAAAIAEEFVVSLATVRTQIRSILAKLEVTSQLEAVALARQRYG